MQTPVEIDFQGVDKQPDVRNSIEQHVAELEQRFGRVTACRVVLKGPGDHHRTGGLYEVNIRLALPGGREVNVDRTATADERHSDLTFAINDAFKRARRQLQDHVRHLQGQVKPHEVQPTSPVRKMAVSLTLILAVILGIGIFVKRWLIQRKVLTPNSQIRIITQHYLGPRKSLAIVHVAGESLLIGITDHDIRLVKQLSLIDDEVPANLPKRFDEELTFTENTQPEQGETFSMRSLKEVVSSRLKNMREI